jgi:hypothetical protein
MKEPYGEGVAIHTGPESCVGDREGAHEALTGEGAGRVLSRENPQTSGRRRRGGSGRPHLRCRQRKTPRSPARSQTPSTPPKHLAREPGEPLLPRHGWRGGARREV